MGCNCKATEKILKIQKTYGYDSKATWGENLIFKTSEIFKLLVLSMLMVIFSPIILVVILVLIYNGKTTFNVNNILEFLLRKNKQ